MGQESPKLRSEEGPKMVQDVPKWSQSGPKMGRDGPRWCQDPPSLVTQNVSGNHFTQFSVSQMSVSKRLQDLFQRSLSKAFQRPLRWLWEIVKKPSSKFLKQYCFYRIGNGFSKPLKRPIESLSTTCSRTTLLRRDILPRPTIFGFPKK